VFIEDAVWDRVAAEARAAERPTAALLRDLLTEALDARTAHRGAVPATKADELRRLMESLTDDTKRVESLIGYVGQAVLGMQQLLVFWTAREAEVEDGVDELFADMAHVGAQAWLQVLDELGTGPAKKLPDEI
jgi:hypothetical protein